MMICLPCREGGVANRAANVYSVDGQLGYVSIAAHNAGLLHEQCEAPSTCPCQHLTGLVIQRA